MRLSEAFPSNYLAANDIPDEGELVTIRSYKMTDIGQGDRKQRKPILYFEELDKGLVLNKTNANVLKEILHSDDLDDWINKKITLVPREVEFQGETVWAIRIKIPRPAPSNRPSSPQRRSSAEPPPEPPRDDEPPF